VTHFLYKVTYICIILLIYNSKLFLHIIQIMLT